MRITGLIVPMLCLAVIALSGCGGGGGGGSEAVAPQAASPAPTTILSGMASKGPIIGGTVRVFAVRFGVEDRSSPIGMGQTDDRGNYSIDIGNYQGPVLVEVSGGSYTDEVSGIPVALNAPLHAVISNAVAGMTPVAVTPFTELAFRKARGRGSLTSDSIDDSNARIAAAFSLNNIVSTLPIVLGDSHERRYATACGSISQLVNDNRHSDESLDDALPRILTRMGAEQEYGGGFSIDSLYRINDSISRFSSSGNNRSGAALAFLPIPASGLVKLSTSGNGQIIAGIDVTVALPAGVTVQADPLTGEVLPGAVTISGVAAGGSNKLSMATFTPASGGSSAKLRMVLVNVGGFGTGEFVTLRFNLASGATFPAADAFSVTSLFAKGPDGSGLAGITVPLPSVAGI